MTITLNLQPEDERGLLAPAPLRGAGLDLERTKDYPRAFEIE